MPVLPPVPEMQRAYQRSDASYDGIFFFGVKTTRVFCRPSCEARKPRVKNVVYFSSPREAVFSGYRPCKRCRPMAAVAHPPAWMGRLLLEVERDPSRRLTDATIKTFGVDPARVRRYFRKHHGMTFLAYCRGRRLGKALDQIRNGARLDDAALGYGYNSHSGFRDAFSRTFGTPPGKSRATESISLTWIESPLGPLIAGATDENLVLLEFTDRRMLETQIVALRRHLRRPIVPGENEILSRLKSELAAYFGGRLKKFSIPLHFPGSDFQRRVWKELLKIPFGTTVSYETIAQRIHARRAPRAVGRSNGLNRIAIVIPCHRVVTKNGDLGGYGGGRWRKQALLELERGERKFPEGGTGNNDLERAVKGHPSSVKRAGLDGTEGGWGETSAGATVSAPRQT